MKRDIDYKILLRRDGQAQFDRLAKELRNEYVQVDEITQADFISFAKQFAALVQYFDPASTAANNVNGDWTTFFEKYDYYFLTDEGKRNFLAQSSIPPHLSLHAAFWEVLQQARTMLNSMTEKHLDFYYEDVLRLYKKLFTPDRAHLVFELKKNAQEQMIPQGALFKGGKDDTGKELMYRLLHDVLVNKSKVEFLHSLYIDPRNKNNVYFAPVSDSADGQGAPLDNPGSAWNAFYFDPQNEWPRATPGFAVASNVLAIQEGNRTITATVLVSGIGIADFSPGNLFKVYLTGPKGWIGPKIVVPTIVPGGDGSTISFDVSLNASDPAVVKYDFKLHGGSYETSNPVMQVLINPANSSAGYADLKNASLISAKLDVAVSGIKNLILENDTGNLDSKKPFLPFGSQPDVGSNFQIGCEEAFTKKLTGFSLNIDWKNIPSSNLVDYYKEYTQLEQVYSMARDSAGAGSGDHSTQGFVPIGFAPTISLNPDTCFTDKYGDGYCYLPIITSNYDFKFSAFIRDGGSWAQTVENNFLFSTNPDDVKTHVDFQFSSPVSIQNGLRNHTEYYLVSKLSSFTMDWTQKATKQFKLVYPTTENITYDPSIDKPDSDTTSIRPKPGFVTLQLQSSFLHQQYRKQLPVNIQNKVMMNVPIAPEIQNLTLNYTASSGTIGFQQATLDNFLDPYIEFFHVGPFGQMREHAYPKTLLSFVKDKTVTLLPQFNNEGELYIGISGVKPGDSLALLFQVAESSSDPDVAMGNFSYEILCDNYWKTIEHKDIILQSSDIFQESGILSFTIPLEASDENTLFPGGRIWVKIAIADHTRGACKLISVQANAAIVEFQDRGNSSSHLAAPLPSGSISKFVSPLAPVKLITQPFASFGGREEETSDAYHTRVSERLRHKNRSITIWDYERLILENFPSVYKVKCIPHCDGDLFYTPRNTTVILIPDLTNRNAVDPLHPKVNRKTLNEVTTLLQKHSSPWASVFVMNPEYQTVKLDFKVVIREGYELNYYLDKLNQEIVNFLSPWVEYKSDIHFSGRLHKSTILKFIEDREYVDYLADFKMYLNLGVDSALTQDIELAEATNPKAILVSAAQHQISILSREDILNSETAL